eukprot:EG_transcript_41386
MKGIHNWPGFGPGVLKVTERIVPWYVETPPSIPSSNQKLCVGRVCCECCHDTFYALRSKKNTPPPPPPPPPSSSSLSSSSSPFPTPPSLYIEASACVGIPLLLLFCVSVSMPVVLFLLTASSDPSLPLSV